LFTTWCRRDVYRAAMSLIMTLLALAASAHSAVAVPNEPRTDTIAPENFGAGVLATPALEGGGPWFLSAVRLSAPLGSTHGLDIEAGRIFGGSTKYAEIDRFAAAQFRFVRNVAPGAPTVRYWLAGLRYTNRKKPDAQGSFLRRDPDVSLLIGHGWKQTLGGGACVLTELGFAGGGGIMAYLTIGVQWGPPRKRPREQRGGGDDPEDPGTTY
jgi:hypothetical protein